VDAVHYSELSVIKIKNILSLALCVSAREDQWSLRSLPLLFGLCFLIIVLNYLFSKQQNKMFYSVLFCVVTQPERNEFEILAWGKKSRLFMLILKVCQTRYQRLTGIASKFGGLFR